MGEYLPNLFPLKKNKQFMTWTRGLQLYALRPHAVPLSLYCGSWALKKMVMVI